MNDQEINIAIAEACGWRIVQGDSLRWRLENTITGYYRAWRANEVMAWSEGQNYCADLNAMHEAEKWLLANNGPGIWGMYVDNLRLIVGDQLGWMIHATARQRAEAFLRTIGKWRDG